MSWPQWTYIALFAIEWLHTLARHGEPKTGLAAKHDVGIQTAGIGIAVFLLWQGGFFG